MLVARHGRVVRTDGLKRRDRLWMGAEDLVVPLTELESGKVFVVLATVTFCCVLQGNSSGDIGGCKWAW